MQMQFGDFIFKENPTHLKLIYSKNIAFVNVPDLGTLARNLGRAARIVKGEGAFLGERASFEFERLVALFELNQASSLLILPGGEMYFCYFSKLEMLGDGSSRKVRYCFEFVEDIIKKLNESSPKIAKYTAQKGDTLTQIALRNNIGVDRILAKNPQLKQASPLHQGQEVIL